MKKRSFFSFYFQEARYILEKDPAMHSFLSVLLFHPGLKARLYHRLAHALYKRKHYFLADFLFFRARKKTGIELHPGAELGDFLFIDHGAGLVVGETAKVGDYCTLYHGVTLGAVSKQGSPRHPHLGDHVLVGAHAQVLGALSIGSGAKVASNAIVLADVKEGQTVIGLHK